jgi:hypothetical protein
MSINVLFTDVSSCDDPKGYIREKLYSAWEELPKFDLDQLANIAYGEGKPVSLPLCYVPQYLTQRVSEYLTLVNLAGEAIYGSDG